MKLQEQTGMQEHAVTKQVLQHSPAFKRKRKLLLILPLITVPFITMAFWALGGGQATDQGTVETRKGLQLQLPESKPSETDPVDKLRFYEKAERDSLQLEEWMRTDPNYRQKRDSLSSQFNELQMLTQSTASKYNYQLNPSPYNQTEADPEQELMQKMAVLQQQINSPHPSPTAATDHVASNGNPNMDTELTRLEQLVQSMQQDQQSDPEMQKINGTLEKILDIQHPERVKEKLREQSSRQKGIVFPVLTMRPKTISLLDSGNQHYDPAAGFFGMDDAVEENQSGESIEAVVHANQTLVNGAVIRMRITNDLFINGLLLPKGTLVNGKVSLNDERLEINVSSIRLDKHLLPVNLEAYDMDGLQGIYIPGAISRDVAKESANSSLQQLDLISIDPSLKAQVATAGVNGIKNLLGRKVKQIKVTVKAGHQLLLRDKNRESIY